MDAASVRPDIIGYVIVAIVIAIMLVLIAVIVVFLKRKAEIDKQKTLAPNVASLLKTARISVQTAGLKWNKGEKINVLWKLWKTNRRYQQCMSLLWGYG